MHPASQPPGPQGFMPNFSKSSPVAFCGHPNPQVHRQVLPRPVPRPVGATACAVHHRRPRAIEHLRTAGWDDRADRHGRRARRAAHAAGDLVGFLNKQWSAGELKEYWHNDYGSFYFPIRQGGSTATTPVPSWPHSPSHIEVPQPMKDAGAGHHHLMATLVGNLPFLQGYYPHDFESRVHLYLANRELTETYPQGHLKLQGDNPEPTRTHRVKPQTAIGGYAVQAVAQHGVKPADGMRPIT